MTTKNCAINKKHGVFTNIILGKMVQFFLPFCLEGLHAGLRAIAKAGATLALNAVPGGHALNPSCWAYIFMHFHAFSYIFIHVHTFSYIFIHFHTFPYIFIHFHTFSYMFIVGCIRSHMFKMFLVTSPTSMNYIWVCLCSRIPSKLMILWLSPP